jgi:subtilisin family serine protease
MSFFVDPWLFNCLDNPADSPEEQQEQRVIRIATGRALAYAHDHGVTLISAEGNEHANLDDPSVDVLSPDYPQGAGRSRSIDDLCQVMPTMGNDVIGVTSVGPSRQKADYSDYSASPATVAAPGGYSSDFFGTPKQTIEETMILSAYPASLAKAQGQLAPDGSPIDPRIVRDCQGGTCAYYQYAEGTSMASPHATGVAALIVSQYGKQASGSAAGQLTMDPDDVAARLRASATDHACPVPALVSYAETGRPPDFDALCVGTTKANNFYGDGIVNALAAVTGKNP